MKRYDCRLRLWSGVVWLAVAPLCLAGGLDPSDRLPACGNADAFTALADKGVTFPFSYIGEGFANLSGGYRQGAVCEGLASAGVKIDLGKLIGWDGASMLIDGLYPHGAGPTERYVHDFNSVSNIEAYDSARLSEAWFQQEFDRGRVSIRAGLMLADSEFFVSKSGGLFLNGAFGAMPVLSMNLDAPVYPLAAPGIRLSYAPDGPISLQMAAFAGDVGNAATTNRHGLYFFRGEGGSLLLGELAYSLNPPPGPCDDPCAKNRIPCARPLAGIYKLGAYDSTVEPGLLGGTRQPVAHYAIYGIADQELWHEPGDPDQGVNAFLRVGGTPDRHSVVSCYVDAGLNFVGLLPARDHDVLGIGVSHTKINGDLLDATGTPVAGHHETILELTYLICTHQHLSIQPDIQYLFNPGATIRQKNALVVGLRCASSF